MYKADVVAFFGSQKATAQALCISESAVCQWGEIVPGPRQGHVKYAMDAEAKVRAEREKKEERKKARRKAA